jgi:N-acetylglucosaminyldiphosphoundecaprenol N-acetyl-beta-D-mannosaminyltransferase
MFQPHCPFLDVDFTPLDRAKALAAVVARAGEPGFAYVATPNVAHVVDLHADKARRAPLYEAAWLRLNDSRILEVLGKASGLSLPVAAGSDLTADLFETQIKANEPVTIIGGDAALIGDVKARFGLLDVRWHDAPMGLAHKAEAIAAAAAFVAANPARFVFLCVGAPQQEMVAKAILDRRDCSGVGLCVGASLEFLTGRVARAPVWMQRARLEWLHRLACEPGRLGRRYLIEGPRIFLIWLRWRRAQRTA